MMGGGFPQPMASNYQHDPEKVAQAVSFLEQRAREAKGTIEELLYMLDYHQEKVPWPDMLEKFASLASAMSNVESGLKKSGIQSASTEDHGALLRTHVLVPQRLQLEPDEHLQQVTQNRLYSWNHDVVPDYLRTKMNPEMEHEEMQIDIERNNKGTDMVGRQIGTLNKHVDSLMQSLPISDKGSEIMDKPTNNREDTTKLVRAIMCGEGLRAQAVPRPQPPPTAAPGPGQMPPQMQRPPGGMGGRGERGVEMNVPVCRSRAGSSRADFVGIEPRINSPAPERRPSQLAGINRVLHCMIEEFRHTKPPPIVQPDDAASLLITGCSDPVNIIEILTNNPHTPTEIVVVLFPWMQVCVRVSHGITLSYLKTQLFDKLQPMKVPGYSMEASDYCFRTTSETGEIETYYLEEIILDNVHLGKYYPMISLFPREGVHAEKAINKSIGTILTTELIDLEGELSDELKACRARLWTETNGFVKGRSSGYKHYAFPEERVVSMEETPSNMLLSKINGAHLQYELYYRPKEDEEENCDENFFHVKVMVDKELTPAGLIKKATDKLRTTGHEIDNEPYLLQLVGRKSFLTGTEHKLLQYQAIRSLFGNYKNPKFVLRRASIVLIEYPQPRELMKPAYVLAEESRVALEPPEPPAPSVWTIDENLLVRPMSYSNLGIHHEHASTIVVTFTFFLGGVVLRRLASKEISPRNPRWSEPPISTGIYMKDMPESTIMCIQVFELRRERVKQKSISKEKKEDEKEKEAALKRESESDMDEFHYHEKKDHHDLYRGWPEFIRLLRDKEDDVRKGDKKDERMVVTPVAWANVPLFDWHHVMTMGVFTYNLWLGDANPPPNGRIGQMKTEGRQAYCRVTLEFSTTISNRHNPPPLRCSCMEDDKWVDVRDKALQMEAQMKHLSDQEEQDVEQFLANRFTHGKSGMPRSAQEGLWRLRYVVGRDYPDALILIMDSEFVWHNRENFGELYYMLLNGAWNQISIPAAITILSTSGNDRLIRQFAVKALDESLDSRNFTLFILPMIQALKRETWAFNDLGLLLLRRGLQDYRTGHKVFWLLRSELILIRDTIGSSNEIFRRLSILIEAFLRGNEDFVVNITKKVTMVERIMQLTTMVKNYNKDVASQKLREELRENCTGLENIDSPLDATAVLGELIIDKCKVLGSAKMPLRLCWKNISPFSQHYLPTYEIIFKNGDDLRQDMLVVQMLEVMDSLWLERQIDCCLSPYPVLPTGYKVGMIGVVPNSCTIFQIQSEGGKVGTAVKSLETTFLNKFIRNNTATSKEYLEAVDRFLMSCVGYSVATFIMGIKDRHNDNIMVSRDGRLFHIDFGHILGHGKKKLGIQRDRVPFVLVEHFLNVINKGMQFTKDSHDIVKYQNECNRAYCVLWDSRYLFLSLFTAMKSMELPELSTDEDIDHLKKTLQVSADMREDAAAFFNDIFDEAFAGSWSTKTNWFFHTVKHM